MSEEVQRTLLLSEDISVDPTPLKKPTSDSPHVLVIGGGVIGLTTAWLLLDQGVKVTILSKEWASWTDHSRLSSQSAGALWKCLPLECGPNAVLENLTKNQRWTLESYSVYRAMASIPEFQQAIELRPCTILTTGAIDDNQTMVKKLDWIKENDIPGFRRDKQLFHEYGINLEHAGGLVEAYEYIAPVINVDIAMGFLMDIVKSKGARLLTRTVEGDLLDQESQLLEHYQADAIVNASGLGATEIAADPSVYGLHGALLRVVNDGSDFPIVENIMVVSSTKSSSSGGEGAFILPRKDNILALGTISKAMGGAADLTIDSPEVKEMRSRCEDLLPCLKNARLDPSYPIVQGTRPQRKSGVRVEKENRRAHSRIIHSYGHGGAGWSLAFGTAREVVTLLRKEVLCVSWASSTPLSNEVLQKKKLKFTTEVDYVHPMAGLVPQETC